MKVLYKTIHGSHLYGLAHEGSDNDFYTVIDKVKTKKATYARQTIVGDEDSMVIDFGTWLGQCAHGTPQALEAMFSTMALHDDLSAFRAGYRVSTGVYDTYLRTIKSFILTDEYKKKRHGLRLAINLSSIREYGRFNPTLNEYQIERVTDFANLDADLCYEVAKQLAWA